MLEERRRPDFVELAFASFCCTFFNFCFHVVSERPVEAECSLKTSTVIIIIIIIKKNYTH